jgi:hypothetical protein
MMDRYDRLDNFISYLVHRVDSGRWLFDGEHPTIESIFIQWKFHQALESVNEPGNCMKTDRQATRMSSSYELCSKTQLDRTG